MKCENCGADIRPGSRFCLNCGQEVKSKVCPNCGQHNSPSLKNCTHCGESLDNTSEESGINITYSTPEVKRSGLSTMAIVLITIIATIAVGSIFILAYQKSTDKKTPAAPTTTQQVPAEAQKQTSSNTQSSPVVEEQATETDEPIDYEEDTDTETEESEPVEEQKQTADHGPFYASVTGRSFSDVYNSAVSTAFTAEASSYRPAINGHDYYPSYAVDGDSQTAWIEGSYDSSGEDISVTYNGSSPVEINQIAFFAGYTKDSESFSTNSAPQELALYYNNSYFGNIVFDSMTQSVQVANIPSLTVLSGDTLRFEIVDHFEGSAEELNADDMDDVAITEIIFL